MSEKFDTIIEFLNIAYKTNIKVEANLFLLYRKVFLSFKNGDKFVYLQLQKIGKLKKMIYERYDKKLKILMKIIGGLGTGN